jgi:hypothetical protein
MDDFGKINAVYASYFNEQTALRDSPSSLFTKNVNVEISMIAIDKRSCMGTKKPNSKKLFRIWLFLLFSTSYYLLAT